MGRRAMKTPAIRDVVDIVRSAETTSCGLPDGRYVPARMLPYYSLTQRWKAAWLVFTGQADAVTWPGQ